MATLSLSGHKRGRSSSTTTAIQRPGSNTGMGRTMSSTLTRTVRRDGSDTGLNTPSPSTLTFAPTRSNTLASTSSSLSSTPSLANVSVPVKERAVKSWFGYWRERRSNDFGGSESGWSSFTASTPSSLESPPRSPRMDSNVGLGINAEAVSLAVGDRWSQQRAVRRGTVLPLLLVLLLFPLSTLLIIGTMWTLPIRLPHLDNDDPNHTHSVFPKTVADLRALAWALKGYSETGPWELAHVLTVLGVVALWKHAWSIPGSALLNILTGTLLPPVLATLLQTSLTTLGSLLSTILATPLTPIITRFFPSAISLTRSALEGAPSATPTTSVDISTPPFSTSPSASSITLVSPSNSYPPSATFPTSKPSSAPWARLAVLRLIGIVPWSGINIASGVCSVPLKHCATGAWIGTLPWTAVTCQLGDILQTIATSPVSPNQGGGVTVSSVLTSPDTIFKLVLLTVISLAPILARERLARWLNGSQEPAQASIATGRDVFGEDVREGGRKRKTHRKKWSVEWWRRSLSLTRGKDEGEENVELLGVGSERA